jgi:anti-sigma factor RsiW
MQHLDEGTIHSWLDGALSADEAARAEAHVKECPQCAAAVAEARGFIAASSRILTALDNAPRGVIPVAAPKKRVDPIVWRVAATLLVVAAGTLVVFKNGGREARIATISADTSQNAFTATNQNASTAVAPTAPAGDEGTRMTDEPAAPLKKPGNSTRGTTIGSLQPNAGPTEKSAAKAGAVNTSPPTSRALSALAPRVLDQAEARAPASQPNIAVRDDRKVAAPGSVVAGNISSSSGNAGRAAPIPQTLSPIRLRGVNALDTASEQFPLKMVGHPRKLGVMVTLYEVAPGDTVTFTEPVSLQLDAVVVTGVGTAEPVARQSAGKAAAAPARRAAAAASSAPDSQRAAPALEALAPAPSAPVPATRVEVANGVTTISWPDPTTGNVLTLSGRMPEARLQQIRISIERERAAAAAKKKP